jgi:hypothetical protein
MDKSGVMQNGRLRLKGLSGSVSKRTAGYRKFAITGLQQAERFRSLAVKKIGDALNIDSPESCDISVYQDKSGSSMLAFFRGLFPHFGELYDRGS